MGPGFDRVQSDQIFCAGHANGYAKRCRTFGYLSPIPQNIGIRIDNERIGSYEL